MNISWNHFTAFAIPVLISWMLAIITIFATKKRWLNQIFTLAGIVGFATFIVLLWISLDRPPMRTMGETRLWYSFFLSTIGFVMYAKWKYSWIQAFSLVVASVFVFINIFKPEIHSKNLMPALQSIWFVPHVTAYILSYSFLSAAAISAVILLW